MITETHIVSYLTLNVIALGDLRVSVKDNVASSVKVISADRKQSQQFHVETLKDASRVPVTWD